MVMEEISPFQQTIEIIGRLAHLKRQITESQEELSENGARFMIQAIYMRYGSALQNVKAARGADVFKLLWL